MQSVFGTAMTKFGPCCFGYIDDKDLLKMLKDGTVNSTDVNNLKDCKVYDEPKTTDTAVIISDPDSKKKALEKLKWEMENIQQLKLFLSTLPKEQQRQVVKEMLEAIIPNL